WGGWGGKGGPRGWLVAAGRPPGRGCGAGRFHRGRPHRRRARRCRRGRQDQAGQGGPGPSSGGRGGGRAAGWEVEWLVATRAAASIPFGAVSHLLPSDRLGDDRLDTLRRAAALLAE